MFSAYLDAARITSTMLSNLLLTCLEKPFKRKDQAVSCLFESFQPKLTRIEASRSTLLITVGKISFNLRSQQLIYTNIHTPKIQEGVLKLKSVDNNVIIYLFFFFLIIKIKALYPKSQILNKSNYPVNFFPPYFVLGIIQSYQTL